MNTVCIKNPNHQAYSLASKRLSYSDTKPDFSQPWTGTCLHFCLLSYHIDSRKQTETLVGNEDLSCLVPCCKDNLGNKAGLIACVKAGGL